MGNLEGRESEYLWKQKHFKTTALEMKWKAKTFHLVVDFLERSFSFLKKKKKRFQKIQIKPTPGIIDPLCSLFGLTALNWAGLTHVDPMFPKVPEPGSSAMTGTLF